PPLLIGAILLLTVSGGVPASAGMGTWTTSGPSTGGNGLALAIDPTNPSIVYDGTGGDGLYKSIDGGDTWAPANGRLPLPLSVESIAEDPSAPESLYIGTSLFSFSTGLWKSTDGGGRWSLAEDGIPASDVANSLAIDPASPSTVYA